MLRDGLTLGYNVFSANSLQSPYKKLKEALSSVEAFEKHYLVRTDLLAIVMM